MAGRSLARAETQTKNNNPYVHCVMAGGGGGRNKQAQAQARTGWPAKERIEPENQLSTPSGMPAKNMTSTVRLTYSRRMWMVSSPRPSACVSNVFKPDDTPKRIEIPKMLNVKIPVAVRGRSARTKAQHTPEWVTRGQDKH